VFMKSVRKMKMIILKILKVSMGSGGLEKRPLHSSVSLFCISTLLLHEDMQKGNLGGMLGVRKRYKYYPCYFGL
jgi:hypothetical protein